jgi:U3 small nucleolar RNA-associated protein 7
MLSDTLRIRRAEKEKRRQEIGLLGKLEKMPIKEFVKVVS